MLRLRAVRMAGAALLFTGVLIGAAVRAQDDDAHADARAAGEDGDAKRRLEGEWRLDASPEEARQVVDTAIAEAAEAFNFLARPVVRSRLSEGTPILDRYAIDFEGDRVTVRHEGEEHTTRLDHTETVRTPTGSMRLTQRLRPNGQLVQRFESDEGSRTYVFTPLRDGRIRVGITTDSPRMPQPMFFLLDYRRA